MTDARLWAYIAVMAAVTYLVRMLPLALVRRRLKSRFVKSFLYYVPYAVLAAMTVPAVFGAAASPVSAAAGFALAAALAWRGAGLLPVALAACGAVFAAEWALGLW